MAETIKYLLCPKCKRRITTDKRHVSPDYFGACLHCDEDFYKIELEEVTEVMSKEEILNRMSIVIDFYSNECIEPETEEEGEEWTKNVRAAEIVEERFRTSSEG